MHVKLNRTLSTIALVLGIVLMAAIVVFGVSAVSKLNQLSNSTSAPEAPITYDAPTTDAGCDYEGGPDCTSEPIG